MIGEWIKSILGKTEATETKSEPKPVYHDRAAIELKVREIVAELQNRDISEITLETKLQEDEVGNSLLRSHPVAGRNFQD